MIQRSIVMLVSLLAIVSISCNRSTNERPNIVLIYTDDMNFDDLGIYNPNVITPHINKLANEGMIFSRYYASSPVCTPSRYGMLTGRYASRSLTLVNRYPSTEPAFLRWNTHIEAEDKTIAHILNGEGYRTGMVGKYHNFDNEIDQQNCSQMDPKSEEGSRCVAENYVTMQDSVKRLSGFEYVESLYANNLHALGLPDELQHHNMEWVTSGALDFIDQNEEEPFFLYVATTIPHGPSPLASMKGDARITTSGYLNEVPDVQASRESVFERIEDAELPESAAVYTWLDDAVGAIVAKLEEVGELENTVILFASDHSGAFGGRGKMTNYEGGVHTPAFMWWPDKIAANSLTESLVANIDYVPTILDIAQVEKPENYISDGYSLMPMVTGKKDKIRDSIFLEITYSRGIVTDRWKYLATRFPNEIQEQITAENFDQWNQEGLTATRDTLHGVSRSRYNAHELYPGYFDQNQLYDLMNDPGEQSNLADDSALTDTLEYYRNLLAEYLEQFPHSFGEFKDNK